MTTYSVSSGVTSTGITLSGGDFLYVSAGGTADSTTLSGGIEVVYSGGTANSTTVKFGGDAFVLSDGAASFTTVAFGGSELVSLGGTAVSTRLVDGQEYAFSGGTASFTTVSFGGTENVYPGGTAVSTTVSSGGFAIVSGGGTASGITVSSGGFEVLSYGGSATSTTVSRGGTEVVSGGSASDTTVYAGGTEAVRLGSSVVLNPGSGTSVLYSSGVTDGTRLSGGTEVVSSGGLAISTTVSSGGHEVVESFGSASVTMVSSGGFQVVSGSGVVSGTFLLVGGTLDDIGLTYAAGGSARVTSGDVLSVTVGGASNTFHLSGTYTDVHFDLAPDATSGTLITALAGAPCYRSGTRVLTDRGEVMVQDLLVGDCVQTVLGGSAAPIIWVGRREVDCVRHKQPHNVWPVRVVAGAFGPGRPHRDLFLSPDHAVYVAEVLIPVRHLINGSTIAQVPMERVTYYHVELPRHDVLLAEGLPAESFLDMKDGSNYANRPGPVRLYPDFSVRMWEAFGCARLIVTGPELEAARALAARFATRRDAA